MTKFAIPALLAGAAIASLATGCAKDRDAPLDPGVCNAVVEQPDKSLKFNKVADNIPNLEHCAAELEKMRINFLKMGGSNKEIAGSFQGHFIFLQNDGIYSSETYDGPRYITMVRYNGKLVMPGAVPQ